MKKNDAKEEIKITKEFNMGELVYKHPSAEEVLLDYGLHCAGCFANSFDSVEAGAKAHGMTDAEIDEMLERVNEVLNFKE